jgi:hypothetical protein
MTKYSAHKENAASYLCLTAQHQHQWTQVKHNRPQKSEDRGAFTVPAWYLKVRSKGEYSYQTRAMRTTSEPRSPCAVQVLPQGPECVSAPTANKSESKHEATKTKWYKTYEHLVMMWERRIKEKYAIHWRQGNWEMLSKESNWSIATLYNITYDVWLKI